MISELRTLRRKSEQANAALRRMMRVWRKAGGCAHIPEFREALDALGASIAAQRDLSDYYERRRTSELAIHESHEVTG